jgi:hypothetical protein
MSRMEERVKPNIWRIQQIAHAGIITMGVRALMKPLIKFFQTTKQLPP